MKITLNQTHMNNFKEGVFRYGRCTVIVSIDGGRWHMSISTPTASPSYKEIKKARYKFIPDNIVMAQIFPSKEDFVNVHVYCHHLWEIGRSDTPLIESEIETIKAL